MKRNLIICPKCLKQVLGEILPNRMFRIMRFHNGYTDIAGRDFGVVCGACGELVFIRKEEANVLWYGGKDTSC